MKFNFKIQQYQTDAVDSVVNCFKGQPYIDNVSYRRDIGNKRETQEYSQMSFVNNYDQGTLDFTDDFDESGFKNENLFISSDMILSNIKDVQQNNNVMVSDSLVDSMGACSLDVEMETGTGKTYVYIKTMFELNKRYGWSKFIVVVPSIAIREGVKKSFEITQDHFMEHYGKKARFFVYNSSNLNQLDSFSSNAGINVMIINMQAFNTSMKEGGKSKEARIIYDKRDEFGSRRPIDVIKANNPIIILDEPQKMGGDATQKALKNFNPLFTLNYSATHAKHHNLVYALDAVDAYNQHLVKKIEVKGFQVKNFRGTDHYLYLEDIIISPKHAPRARIEYEKDYKTKGINHESRIFDVDDNLYEISNNMEQYKGYRVSEIDPIAGTVTFTNGEVIHRGDVVGDVSEKDMRRVQIRETIKSHLEKEEELFNRGIKTLSLFFIDEVAKYRRYDEDGEEILGEYGQIFEQEYNDIVNEYITVFDTPYQKYLKDIDVKDTHKGYFSIDKKGHAVDSEVKRGIDFSDDISAYDLILKNKERLLSFAEPTRFIFSHSALREGWDNPNVFQICTLKQSSSDVRKRQEVGRGLRLCVNQDGERMDANVLGNDVQSINVLTVIASESYDSFAKGLQTELADAVAGRPVAVTADLFKGKTLVDTRGNEQVVDGDTAQAIFEDLISSGYVKRGVLTDKYYADKANGTIQVAEEVADSRDSVINILDSVYDSRAMQPENARDKNVELQVDPDKLAMPEFKALWKRISPKSVYVVDFDTDELVNKAIASINRNLHVPKIFFKVETGAMEEIKSKDSLLDGSAFSKSKSSTYDSSKQIRANSSVKYDLIGKLVGETGLTRKAVVAILTGIERAVFEQFKFNPEEFIIKAAALINDEKATAIIQHITYNVLDEHYDTDIFTEPTIKGKLGTNAMKAQRHLYDHIVYDSTNERDFAANLDTNTDVAVYVKLPDSFYIATPVGHYNPDWAIAFYKGTVKHIYFVAETKGSMSSMQLRLIEESKIHCAREHFKAISNGNVVYDVVDSYRTLLERVMK